jgi:hypothetical protein
MRTVEESSQVLLVKLTGVRETAPTPSGTPPIPPVPVADMRHGTRGRTTLPASAKPSLGVCTRDRSPEPPPWWEPNPAVGMRRLVIAEHAYPADGRMHSRAARRSASAGGRRAGWAPSVAGLRHPAVELVTRRVRRFSPVPISRGRRPDHSAWPKPSGRPEGCLERGQLMAAGVRRHDARRPSDAA